MLVARSLLYAGILASAGGVLFLLLVTPAGAARRSGARMVQGFAAVSAFVAVLAIGIHGASLAGGPPAILASAVPWRLSLSSSFGQAVAMAAAALALIACGLWLQRSVGFLLAGIGAVAALFSFTMSGHVISAEPRWQSVGALLVHVTAAAFWTGALVPLYRSIGLLKGDAARIVQRFSHIALAMVPVLIAAGVAIAWLQVTSLNALFETTYGQFLLLKVALVAVLIAVAAYNKLRLTPALARGEGFAAAALRRAICVELALVGAILLATAALGINPPPRIHSDADHAGLHDYQEPTGLWLTVTSEGRRAQIVVASARSGPNSIYARFSNSGGTPLDLKEVTLVAANPAAGIAPIRRKAQPTPTGAWNVDDLVLVPAGKWSIRIDALVSDFEQTTFETEIELR